MRKLFFEYGPLVALAFAEAQSGKNLLHFHQK